MSIGRVLGAVVLICLVVGRSAQGNTQIIYVDQDATGQDNGTSWTDAYVSLTDAIDGSTCYYGHDCEIWVAASWNEGDEEWNAYLPTSCPVLPPPNGPLCEEGTFYLQDYFHLYGGFAGGETERDQRDWVANVTVLSGDQDNNDPGEGDPLMGQTLHAQALATEDEMELNSLAVVTAMSSSYELASIDGFTITRGRQHGILLKVAGCEIRNCRLYRNGGTDTSGGGAGYGGGIGFYHIVSNPAPVVVIVNCLIDQNIAWAQGGGIGGNGSVTFNIVNTQIVDNYAQFGGGGISMYGKQTALGYPTQRFNLTNTVLGRNVTGGGAGGQHDGGGAIRFVGDSDDALVLDNCTVAKNWCQNSWGGGIKVVGETAATLENTIVWGNRAPQGTPPLSPCAYGQQINTGWGGYVQAYKSCVQHTSAEDLTSGEANHIILDDPNFGSLEAHNPSFELWPDDQGDGWGDDPDTQGVDEGSGDVVGNLHLSAASPCIDIGGNNLVPDDTYDVDEDADTSEPTPDIDLYARITAPQLDCGTPIVDMGAFEYQGEISDCDQNGEHDPCEISDDETLDCNANVILDVCEEEPVLIAIKLTDSFPPHDGSLWRTVNNYAQLQFACPLPALPVQNPLSIRKMLPGGLFDATELAGNFSVTISATDDTLLLIQETTPCLDDGDDSNGNEWFAIMYDGSGWEGVKPFSIHYVLQVGDANGDTRVLPNDLSLIQTDVPNMSAPIDSRLDINGNGTVLPNDQSITNADIPDFGTAKPSGH